MLLGPLQDLINREGNESSATGASGRIPKGQMHAGEKILRKDLVRIGLLGCGGFGAVELREHKKTGNAFARKGLRKGYIVKTGTHAP
mmetsp:Transcript_13130/g.42227  ORF Transcript_13130/g.42227 Transcript_13130/m.42227 type:complete len:87 (-) Transcript_13130:21-281(-)